jgi:hypothetical protein
MPTSKTAKKILKDPQRTNKNASCRVGICRTTALPPHNFSTLHFCKKNGITSSESVAVDYFGESCEL